MQLDSLMRIRPKYGTKIGVFPRITWKIPKEGNYHSNYMIVSQVLHSLLPRKFTEFHVSCLETLLIPKPFLSKLGKSSKILGSRFQEKSSFSVWNILF